VPLYEERGWGEVIQPIGVPFSADRSACIDRGGGTGCVSLFRDAEDRHEHIIGHGGNNLQLEPSTETQWQRFRIILSKQQTKKPGGARKRRNLAGSDAGGVRRLWLCGGVTTKKKEEMNGNVLHRKRYE